MRKAYRRFLARLLRRSYEREIDNACFDCSLSLKLDCAVVLYEAEK